MEYKEADLTFFRYDILFIHSWSVVLQQNERVVSTIGLCL